MYYWFFSNSMTSMPDSGSTIFMAWRPPVSLCLTLNHLPSGYIWCTIS